jgi:hypothetical protein
MAWFCSKKVSGKVKSSYYDLFIMVSDGNLAGNIMLIIFSITVVLADHMWRKLPEDHPALYTENIET